MSEIINILVPTDFSAESANALKMAVAIARPLGAEITLLHIIDKATADFETFELTPHRTIAEETEADIPVPGFPVAAMKSLKQKMQHLTALYPGVAIREELMFDDVHRQIAKRSSSHQTGLIVMGSKGTNEARGLLMGSNTEKVIRTACCPVLAVKGEVGETVLKNICFASDFHSAPETAIRWIRRLQEVFGATLHLVKIITPSSFEISSITHQRIQDFITVYGLTNCEIHCYNHYIEYEGILAFSRYIHADLITMTTHGSTGLMHMFMGSIAEDVANHSEVPVLTFKNEK